MSARWREATAENDYSLPCPGCSQTVPEVLLCIHDDPLCLGCCEREHPHQCRDCAGTRVLITGRDVYGYPTLTTCPTCGGTGRVND